MLKSKLCEATIKWNLRCEGPLLIADGRYSQDEVKKQWKDIVWKDIKDIEDMIKGWYPDKFFINRADLETMIRSIRFAGPKPPDNELGFYVPATSIRGPFRAQAELIIRTLLPDKGPPISACDPFEQKEDHDFISCSKRLEKEEKEREEKGERGEEKKYALVCPACKVFGCAGLASRIYFTDADIVPGPNYRSAYRDMIGIDRFTGGVYKSDKGGANMRLHVLEDVSFTTTITIENYELWHLGLLAYVFRDFEEGRVSIGFGKTEGFGQVKGKVTEISLRYPRTSFKDNCLHHLGSLMREDELRYYKIDKAKARYFKYLEVKGNDLALYQKIKITNINKFWETVAPSFNEYIDTMREARIRAEDREEEANG